MSLAEGPLVDLATLPWYNEPLKKPRPFLVPAEGDQVIEILPAEKENRKIRFKEEILVTEIEDRFFHYGHELEEEEEEAYEIEIVEDDGDADFYLEIVDGEVFYVFETEDDLSEDSMEELLSGDEASESASSFESSMHSGHSGFTDEDLAGLEAPDLDGDDDGDGDNGDPVVLEEAPLPDEIKLNRQASVDDGSEFNLDMEDDNFGGDNEIEIPEDTKKDMERQSAKKEVRRKKREGRKDPPPEPSEHSSSSSSSSSSMSSTTSSSTQSKKESPISQLPAFGSVTNQDLNSQIPQGRKDASKLAQVNQINMSPPPSPSLTGSPPGSPERGSISMNGSQGPMSPTSRRGSILKANAPSPRAETKKALQKPKKDGLRKQQSFTKTYVRAEQFDGEHRVYSWQKPAWAQGHELAPTEKGQKVRQGADLAGPITHVGKNTRPEDPSSPSNSKGIEVDKEEILRRFVSGEIGNGLISNSAGRQRKLKLSVNGAKLREGGDIVKPITKATVIRTPNDINHLANPGVLRPTPQIEKQTPTWQKPGWALGAKKLKPTSKGLAIKGGADLQTPITQRVIADAEAATAANRLLQKTRPESHNVMDSSTNQSWKQTKPMKGSEGGNGLKKFSNHSSEHSKDSSSENNGPGSDCNDPEAEKRRRQQLLARVAKSWG